MNMKKAPAPPKMFTVYDPDGNPHEMLWANARDMTRNAPGWTMQAGLVVHPIPEGVAPAKTVEEQAKQITVVEIPAPLNFNDPYAGIARDVLQTAAADTMQIGVDGRWGEKRVIMTIEEKLSARLTESGDVVGLDTSEVSHTQEEKDARRMRAYKLEAEHLGHEWDEENPPTIKALIEAFAGL